MISRKTAKRIFIAVNDPWVCDIEQDPVQLCRDMDVFLQEEMLTDRLGLRSDFKVDNRNDCLIPLYKMQVHLEAIGTETAIDLGVITRAGVKNNRLILTIGLQDPVVIELPTMCEDLDPNKQLMKKNNYETRNVMTHETDS